QRTRARSPTCRSTMSRSCRPERSIRRRSELDGGGMAQETARTSGSAERYFQQQYGIDSSLTTRLLDEALSRGGEYADLYFEHRLTRDFQFEDQSVKKSSSSIIQGVGIRVVSEESIGYAYSEDLTPEGMAAAARMAAAIAAAQRSAGAIKL